MSKWSYVNDPLGEDYYAKASESVILMSGDCDDYSILMGSCIKAVGGEVRLIRTSTHLYPEVKVCPVNELSDVITLIKRNLFFKESLGGKVYYHLDEYDNVWLNFDYTGDYPGAEFMSGNIIGMMML